MDNAQTPLSQPAQPAGQMPASPQPAANQTSQSAGTNNPPKGSKMPLIIFVVIIILIIAAGVGYVSTQKKSTTSTDMANSNNILSNITPTITAAMMPPSPTPSPINDTSEAGIQKKMDNIDTSLNNASTDIQGVDQGLNDQSVNLSE